MTSGDRFQVSSSGKKMRDSEPGYKGEIEYGVGNENALRPMLPIQNQFGKARGVGRSRAHRVQARRDMMFQKL